MSQVDYQPGFSLADSFFVLDPSGNRIELGDSFWKAGMLMPTYEEICEL